jgi:hypothetical protein
LGYEARAIDARFMKAGAGTIDARAIEALAVANKARAIKAIEEIAIKGKAKEIGLLRGRDRFDYLSWGP